MEDVEPINNLRLIGTGLFAPLPIRECRFLGWKAGTKFRMKITMDKITFTRVEE